MLSTSGINQDLVSVIGVSIVGDAMGKTNLSKEEEEVS
jgi:hypothetical protein